MGAYLSLEKKYIQTPQITKDTYVYLGTKKSVHLKGPEYFDIITKNNVPRNSFNAIRWYTGYGYAYINGYERSSNEENTFFDWDTGEKFDIKDKYIPTIKKASAALSIELNNHLIKKDINVYKEIKLSRLLIMLNDDSIVLPKDLKKLKDKKIYEPGFLSTSLICHNHAPSNKAILKIKIPPGTNAMYVGKVSKLTNELELLIDKGQTLRIDKINLTSRIIKCTLLSKTEDKLQTRKRYLY